MFSVVNEAVINNLKQQTDPLFFNYLAKEGCAQKGYVFLVQFIYLHYLHTFYSFFRLLIALYSGDINNTHNHFLYVRFELIRNLP